MADHFLHYIGVQRLISDDQYGFLAGRFAELQLISCIDSWMQALDSNLCTDIAYIDKARAFDSACHSKLLYKLENAYGIVGKVLSWLHSFLCGQMQCVRVGSAVSESEPVLSGVRKTLLLYRSNSSHFVYYMKSLNCLLLQS